MRPDFGSQSAGHSLAHRNYPADVIHKLQQKHEKIKSFWKNNSKNQIRDQWLYENYPFYQFAVDFGGENFTIKPSAKFIGQHYSGMYYAQA